MYSDEAIKKLIKFISEDLFKEDNDDLDQDFLRRVQKGMFKTFVVLGYDEHQNMTILFCLEGGPNKMFGALTDFSNDYYKHDYWELTIGGSFLGYETKTIRLDKDLEKRYRKK